MKRIGIILSLGIVLGFMWSTRYNQAEGSGWTIIDAYVKALKVNYVTPAPTPQETWYVVGLIYDVGGEPTKGDCSTSPFRIKGSEGDLVMDCMLEGSVTCNDCTPLDNDGLDCVAFPAKRQKCISPGYEYAWASFCYDSNGNIITEDRDLNDPPPCLDIIYVGDGEILEGSNCADCNGCSNNCINAITNAFPPWVVNTPCTCGS